MSTKPTMVLVPGAWSTPSFYSSLQSLLVNRGFQVLVTQHASTGAEPPTKTLNDDVSCLRATLRELCDAGNDVLVLAHSYGGIVSSVAVEGLEKPLRQAHGKKGGVIMITYMVAFVIPPGLSLVQASGGQLMPWIKDEGGYAYNTIGPDGAFNDLAASEQEHWMKQLTHASTPVFYGAASHEPWRVIPTAYILAEEDRLLPLVIQEHMVETLGTTRTYRLQSSHHPFLSMPGKVVDIVDELCSGH
ncbi:Alpha/beta hydrolase fold-1 [Aspergillus avenaceus]|uniref:Alpha/beta hydrolase fold-1 n=1 Tax=Aspergillus avenaceus TaxID=36643 RepID=A0A5N6U6Y7_ASPAV|nr:Alpha/beta hydrolase fold-1 [Aspergillus avenaceus]